MLLRHLAMSVAIVFSLAACGGGGGGGGGNVPMPEVPDDGIGDSMTGDGTTNIERLDRIFTDADTLQISSIYGEYETTALGQTGSGTYYITYDCSGTTCVSNLGLPVTISDIYDPNNEQITQTVVFGEREGFDTVRATYNASYLVPGLESPDGTVFGVWGEHGYSSVSLLDGESSISLPNAPAITGESSIAASMMIGDSSGTNPTGLGSATWRGPAEVASKSTFVRQAGSATIEIPNLSNPSVNVDVTVGGRSIAPSSWDSVPVSQGLFGTGTHAVDYLRGGFFGPNHEESYGVFDTELYIGSFGAQRQ